MTQVLFESHSTSLDNEAGLASGHYDAPLSPSGEQQAGELAERYRSTLIRSVYCSDLQRCCGTAELAFGDRDIGIVRDPRLRECDYGRLTRRPRSEVLSDAIKHLDEPFPGGESFRQAVARVSEFLRELAVRFDGEAVLIIGHRATQYALEHCLNRRPLEEVLKAAWRWQPGWTYQLDTFREHTL